MSDKLILLVFAVACMLLSLIPLHLIWEVHPLLAIACLVGMCVMLYAKEKLAE